MKSNQSLQNKLPSKKDFKTSLTAVIVPTVINFILALYIFVRMPVGYILSCFETHHERIEEVRQNMSICLTSSISGQGYSMTFVYNLGVILVVIGMIFSLAAFKFKMKKKTVNVYYSLSVDRKTMFKNRLLASLLCIALALFVPIVIDVIINICVLGNAGYIISGALFLFAECFVYELAGFVIMTVAMSACHTIVESILFGAGLVTLPTVLLSTLNAVAHNYLRGFDSYSFIYGEINGLFVPPDLMQRFSYLNPLFLGKNINPNRFVQDNIINFVHKDYSNIDFWVKDNLTREEFLGEKISFDYILPLIIWVVISAVIIVIARQIFIKSKAENAGMHASLPILNELFAAEVGLIMMDIWFTVLYEGTVISITNKYINMLVGILLFILAYFIIVMISKRTVKIKLRSLACVGTGVAVSAVCFIVVLTGGLGYSSYVPQASQIEWATVTYANLNTTMAETSSGGGYYADVFSNETLMTPMSCFSDEADIQSVLDINETAVQENDDMSDMDVYFHYQLKNGKTVCRHYSTTDKSIEKQLLSLRDSNAVKTELTYLLSDCDIDDAPITTLLEGSEIDVAEFFYYDDEKFVKEYFESGVISVADSDGNYARENIINTSDFRAALLKDLLSQSYEDRFMPDEKPIGMIEFGDYYDDEIEEYADDTEEYADDTEIYDARAAYGYYGYYIYESMTNTINYLKETGEYDYFDSDRKAEIDSVSVEKCSDIMDAQHERNQFGSYSPTRLFVSNTEYKDDYDYVEGYDYDYDYIEGEEFELQRMSDYFNDSLNITDKKQINELLSLSYPYRYAEDDDYIICINYKNESHKTMLIPNPQAPDYIK